MLARSLLTNSVKNKEKMMKKKNKKESMAKRTDTCDNNPLYIYLQEINKIPLLSKSEEETIAIQAAEGNKAARERLVNANLRFVISVAKKYQGRGLPLEDLVSEGNMGLLNAVNHFDVEKGYRFITYAVWWIRQAIVKAIQEKGRMIRLPCNKANELTKLDKARQAIQNMPGLQNEDIREIANYLAMPEEKAESLMRINQDVVYLDDKVSKYDDSLSTKDLIEDEFSKTPVDFAINSVLKDELEKLINGLEDRAADVIRSHYGLEGASPRTLKEIGETYNLSKERVRQIEKRALGQLQHSTNRTRLKSYIS
jgi:RNA polymerase primary sigma factor